jgi:processive 1,2-diacylglycerol beta-glucosyltransferase
MRRPVRGSRVVVITGSYGAGHDSAAREIAERFRWAGARVSVHDIVDLLPFGTGKLTRAAYLKQITRCPESWEATLRRLQPGTRAHRWTARVLGAGGGRTLELAADADLVISTHPFASQVLGRLRHRGVLRCPVATYLTDASVHALWVAQGVDLHVAIHSVAADQARALGGRTTMVRPLVPARPVDSRTRSELGLPLAAPLAVVVGGSLGIGDLEGTAIELLGAGVTPVVLCGRNDSLLRRLSARPGVMAMGWCDDVRQVFSVADVVIQNSGGFMTLEAMAVGTPLLSYGVLPGHGRTNAAALEREGMAPWARTADELGPTLRRMLDGGAPPLPDEAPDLVELLAGPQPTLRLDAVGAGAW